MAKKRVNELAKQYDLPPTEIVTRLEKAGVTVKGAASGIDEHIATAAIEGKPLPSANGTATEKVEPDAPRKPSTPVNLSARRLQEQKERESQARKGIDQSRGGNQRNRQQRGGGGPKPPPGPGGVRRVVIDSQAARRGPGGPGGGPGGPNRGGPPQNRRPGRGGGRRRRRMFEDTEPAPLNAGQPETADIIRINSGSTVGQVAEYLHLSAAEIIRKLMQLGEMATLTQTLPDDAIELLAGEFDRGIEIVHASDEVDEDIEYDDADEDLEWRPPVVTIMGHVDHGKTSLLDAIRTTEVAAGEAGGITQHIGAYQVHHDDRAITFLDTPGHEAFTAMRARGAQVTDIAVIVVAADDGVRPQTREAVDHAKAAGVPMIVAVNKIDKEGAQPDRVRTEMTNLGLQPEEWGGDTMFVDVSAKAKTNLDELLESIVLLAEVEEYQANPEADASGVVVESRLDPGRGATVTVLVQRGTLKIGDALVGGAHWGRVKAMSNFLGERVLQAGPSEPVEVLGFDSVPDAGENVRVVGSDKEARSLAADRAHRLKTEAIARRQRRRVTLENIFDPSSAAGGQLNLLIKADVSGSLEAFRDEIAKLPQDEIAVDVVRADAGAISESDVNLASATDAIVIGFNVRPVGDARALADREGVQIRTYSVIYRAFEDIRDAMQGMLRPEEVEENVGEVEIREIFRASKIGVIAGCYVTEGKVTRGASVRLVRDGTVVWTGAVESLRRMSDDVREVATGFECGIVLRNYQDVRQGDVLEAFEIKQVERTLGE
ncbi:MAG: translation initiation factor IF-2 [Solirubrobacteraceae bacterium]